MHGDRRPHRAGFFINPHQQQAEKKQRQKSAQVTMGSGKKQRAGTRSQPRSREFLCHRVKVAPKKQLFTKWRDQHRRQSHQPQHRGVLGGLQKFHRLLHGLRAERFHPLHVAASLQHAKNQPHAKHRSGRDEKHLRPRRPTQTQPIGSGRATHHVNQDRSRDENLKPDVHHQIRRRKLAVRRSGRRQG